jgi:hypothetical protein
MPAEMSKNRNFSVVPLPLLVRLDPPSPENPKEATLPLLSLLDPHPFLFLLPHRRGRV